MAENKKIPEIRFKGFEGEWEEKTLDELSYIKTGCPFDSNDFNDNGEFLVITNGNIQDDSSNVYGSIGNRIDIQNNPALIEYILNVNDILVTMDGTVGRSAKVVEQKQILAQRVGRLKGKSNSEFLYQYLNTGKFFKEMSLIAHGGTIKHISLTKIGSYESYIPDSDPEQTQIGIYFQNLDSLISLHQHKYDKLLTVKKAMLEKMFPKEGADVPKIRFKGFEGKWEKKKFSETFMNISNNTLSRANLNYNYGIAKNIHYGDVLIKFGELLDVEKEEIPFITEDLTVGKFMSSKLQNGDIIIADAAEDYTVGKCTELLNVSNEIVLSGLHTIPVRPLITFATGYLGYFLNSSLYHNQLIRLIQGSKVSSISKTAIKDTNVFYPNDLEEQTKIGTFFQNLDTLITQHQKELEKLKNLKKACLEKMFV